MNMDHLLKTFANAIDQQQAYLLNSSKHYLIIKTCLKAINDSIHHFSRVRSKLLELSHFFEKKNSLDQTYFFPVETYDSEEFFSLNKVNYISILSLESLGLKNPSQTQIDDMEKIITYLMSSTNSKHQKSISSAYNNTVAARVLQRNNH